MAESESGKFEAIVLAAGLGARFGGGKLTATFRGRPLIAGALSAALAAPVGMVALAVGDDPALEAAIGSLAPDPRLRLVRVAHAADGMGASLAAAAHAISDDAHGVFVFLGDMPLIGPEIARLLIGALTGRNGVAAPTHEGRRGHPVLFGGDWIAALRGLSGDVGAQSVIRQAGDRFVSVEAGDPGVLFDVDRPEDIRS